MRVRVERSGGFAGRVVSGEADTAELEHSDPGAARQLRELAAGVDFAALTRRAAAAAGDGDAGRRGADRFSYDVHVDADGTSHHVQLGEAAVPAELRGLIDHVLGRPPAG